MLPQTIEWIEKAEGDWNAAQSLYRVRKLPMLQIVLSLEPNWASLAPPLTNLNLYSVGYRYPGKSATKAESQFALTACRKVRRVIRLAFNLPV